MINFFPEEIFKSQKTKMNYMKTNDEYFCFFATSIDVDFEEYSVFFSKKTKQMEYTGFRK